MNEKEILEKAIRKAIDGGWKNKTYERPEWIAEQYSTETGSSYVDQDDFINVTHMLFSHDFAKALWGEDYDKEHFLAGEADYEYNVSGYVWQYHLQQMVIAEDPIKYLGDNI